MNEDHISRIETLWTLIRQAHGRSEDAPEPAAGDRPDARAAAIAEVFERYSHAIYRYLLKVLGSADDADDVFQEFALRWVRGDYRHADQQRGRFRDYLKVSLLRMVSAHRRKQLDEGQRSPLPEEVASNAAAPHESFEAAFRESCREELLFRTWSRLQADQQQGGHSYYTVLNYRANHPRATSEQAAAELNQRTEGPRFTAAGLRKTLQRARQRFSEILLDELRQLIGSSSPEELEQELADLQLHAWCRPGR